MKRIVILLSLVLATATFAAADSFVLEYGSGVVHSGDVGPSYSFFLYNNRAFISVPASLDFSAGGGLRNCSPCDPRQNMILLNNSGRLGDIVGSIRFDAVSFVSSLAPDGILTVVYTAKADILLHLCATFDCDKFTDTFVWDKGKPWRVTAHFEPFPESSLYPYQFLEATFEVAAVPEPSSILLLGSGAAILIRKVRKARA